MIYPEIHNAIESYVGNFHLVPGERKKTLKELADFIERKQRSEHTVNLVFICTHNSRRSHISQIWAQVAAAYYGIRNVFTFSGGTEATAFNDRAVNAMRSAGFKIKKLTDDANPIYEVRYSSDSGPVRSYSKKYDDDINPKKGFGAVMTCARADQNCPIVTGAEVRIAIPYDDPGDFDNTLLEAEMYAKRVETIGLEMLYAFSLIK